MKALIRQPLYIKFIRERVRSGKVMLSQLFAEHEGKIILNNTSSN